MSLFEQISNCDNEKKKFYDDSLYILIIHLKKFLFLITKNVSVEFNMMIYYCCNYKSVSYNIY